MEIKFGFSFLMAIVTAILALFVPQQAPAATVQVSTELQPGYPVAGEPYRLVDVTLSSDVPISLASATIAMTVSAGTSHLEEVAWKSPFYMLADWQGGQEYVTSCRSLSGVTLTSTPITALTLLIEPTTTLVIVDSIGPSTYDQTHFKSQAGEFIPWSTGPPLTVPEPTVLGFMALGIALSRKRLP